MTKQITIEYQEFLAMQDEIEKLKEANSALCQGAPVLQVNEFRYDTGLNIGFYDKEYYGRYDIEKLINVAGNFVAKGEEEGVKFEGVDALVIVLKAAEREVNSVIDRLSEKLSSVEDLEREINKLKNRSLWQRIINSEVE